MGKFNNRTYLFRPDGLSRVLNIYPRVKDGKVQFVFESIRKSELDNDVISQVFDRLDDQVNIKVKTPSALKLLPECYEKSAFIYTVPLNLDCFKKFLGSVNAAVAGFSHVQIGNGPVLSGKKGATIVELLNALACIHNPKDISGKCFDYFVRQRQLADYKDMQAELTGVSYEIDGDHPHGKAFSFQIHS